MKTMIAMMMIFALAMAARGQSTTGTLEVIQSIPATATVEDKTTCTVINITPAAYKATVIRFVTGPECPDPIVLTLDAVDEQEAIASARVSIADKMGEAEQIVRGLGGGDVEAKANELSYQEDIAKQARYQARLNMTGNAAMFGRHEMEAKRALAAGGGQ